MSWDVWYDLAVLEMAKLSDPAKEKLIEAEKAQADPEPVVEERAEPACRDGCPVDEKFTRV